jgi:restriction system protein
MEVNVSLRISYKSNRKINYTFEYGSVVENSDPTKLFNSAIRLVKKYAFSLKENKEFVNDLVKGFNTLLEKACNGVEKIHIASVPNINDLWKYKDIGFNIVFPEAPILKEYPDAPEKTSIRYEIEPSIFEFIFSGFKNKWLKKQTDDDLYNLDYSIWQKRKNDVEKENNEAIKLYENKKSLWQEQKNEYDSNSLKAIKESEEKIARFSKSNSEALEDGIVALLTYDNYPFEFKKQVKIEFNRETGIILVEYDLPILTDLPFVKSIKYVATHDCIEEKYLSEKELDVLFDNVTYSNVLYVINCIYSNVSKEFVNSIIFNGYIEDIDKATGHLKRGCIISIQCSRESFEKTNIEQVDPKAWFRLQKGIGSSKLHSITPVVPIMNISREDKRFVQGYSVVESLDSGNNLAAMDWLDFENLIREIFEKEFSNDGGEVKITQSSRDGGVDAIAFDPDPIRGGKIIIQAKRYTNTVGVSAVRDLYGTLINEGATKGVLVTTSDYGPDAYEFTKGKPITLLNGGHLLALLGKHGHKARINLAEAKKELADKDE